jgi:hypothetical protein
MGWPTFNRMEDLLAPTDDPVPERSLAAACGLGALLVGAFSWSGAAAVLGAWSLPLAPALGWLVAWSCLHGGRRASAGVRVIAWLLSIAAALAGLAALAAFSAYQAAPDAGVDGRAMAEACRGLFAAPPWFGSVAVLLAMAGTSRALRGARSAPASNRGTSAAPFRRPAPAATMVLAGPQLSAGAAAGTSAATALPRREARAA